MTENKSEMFDGGFASCYCGSNGRAERNGDRCGGLDCACVCHLEPPLVELRDDGGRPDELDVKLRAIEANLARLQGQIERLCAERVEACALLRRAADVIVAYEVHTGSETQVLVAIGAYLGRVAPR